MSYNCKSNSTSIVLTPSPTIKQNSRNPLKALSYKGYKGGGYGSAPYVAISFTRIDPAFMACFFIGFMKIFWLRF